jgi:hypothetical protein
VLAAVTAHGGWPYKRLPHDEPVGPHRLREPNTDSSREQRARKSRVDGPVRNGGLIFHY